MQTRLKGVKKEAVIDTEGTMVIIGEKINPTGRKKLAAALQEGHFDFVRELATSQVAAGADVLDVNVGVPGLDDVALMPQVVKIVAEMVGRADLSRFAQPGGAGCRAGQAAGQLGQRRGEIAAGCAAAGQGSRRGGDRPDDGRERHPARSRRAPTA